MRFISIAVLSLRNILKNPFSLVMMFAAPLVITGLLYFAFGGFSGEQEQPVIQQVAIGVVTSLSAEKRGGADVSMGSLFADFLSRDELRDRVKVERIPDERRARQLILSGKLQAAVIFPPEAGSSAADYTEGGGKRERGKIILLRDPASGIKGDMAEALLHQFLNAFTGTSTAIQTASERFMGMGQPFTPKNAEDVKYRFLSLFEKSVHANHLRIIAPKPEKTVETPEMRTMTSLIMAGMIVFFIFFMGANSAQSILQEKESGTLARLFTTPTRERSFIGGKYTSILLILLIQITVLLSVSKLIFRVTWGPFFRLLLPVGGLIIGSAGFGVFIISLLKNTRQVGPVLGGVLTITGMLGGLFTVAVPHMPKGFNTVVLFTPQGWAMKGFKLLIQGGTLTAMVESFLILSVAGVVFCLLGTLFLHRRFLRGRW